MDLYIQIDPLFLINSFRELLPDEKYINVFKEIQYISHNLESIISEYTQKAIEKRYSDLLFNTEDGTKWQFHCVEESDRIFEELILLKSRIKKINERLHLEFKNSNPRILKHVLLDIQSIIKKS